MIYNNLMHNVICTPFVPYEISNRNRKVICLLSLKLYPINLTSLKACDNEKIAINCLELLEFIVFVKGNEI